MEEVHKKDLNTMRLRLYEVHFDLTCESHPNLLQTYFMTIIYDLKIYLIMSDPHYVNFLLMNLFHNPTV